MSEKADYEKSDALRELYKHLDYGWTGGSGTLPTVAMDSLHSFNGRDIFPVILARNKWRSRQQGVSKADESYITIADFVDFHMNEWRGPTGVLSRLSELEFRSILSPFMALTRELGNTRQKDVSKAMESLHRRR